MKTSSVSLLTFAFVFILSAVGFSLFYVQPASAWTIISEKYFVYKNSGNYLYFNGKDDKFKIIDWTPKITVEKVECDASPAGGARDFDSSKEFMNCTGLKIQEATSPDNRHHIWFEEANYTYDLGDVDWEETVKVGGGYIARHGVSTKDPTNSDHDIEAKAGYIFPGVNCDVPDNPNLSDDCAVLFKSDHDDASDFHIFFHAPNSEHEFTYGELQTKGYRTLTFNPNGGSVTDASDGVALLLHPATSGANKLREYVKEAEASTFRDATLADHTFEGWWTTRDTGGVRKYTKTMSDDETLYARWGDIITSGWTLDGSSAVQPTAIRGQTVTFTHKVWNTGSVVTTRDVSSKIVWGDNLWNYTIGSVTTDGAVTNIGKISVGSAVPPAKVRTTSVTIPSTATDGQKICQKINFNNKTQASSAWDGSSSQACVTVSVPVYIPHWSITPGVSVNTPTASPGQTVSWTHSIYNNGPDATSTVNYKWQNSDGWSGEGGASSFSGLASHETKNVPTSPSHTVTQGDVGNNLCRNTWASPKAWDNTDPATAGPACAFIPYNYTLTPSVTHDHSGAIEPGASVKVTPGVSNTGPTKSDNTQWQLNQFIVQPGNTIPNAGGGISADVPCTYFSGVNCSLVKNGTSVFNVGGSVRLGDVLSANPVTVGDLDLGSKICFAFSVQPRAYVVGTKDSRWAHTAPTCLVVGKKPKIQIWAGDLLVGGNVMTSTSVKASNTYGSWAEYGIIASGGISGAASGAAFAGPSGYSGVLTSTCDYNKLSFTSAGSSSCVNSSTLIGNYTNATNMPDVEAFFPGGSPISSPAISPNALGGTHTVGNLTLNPGINLNKTVVIKASGTVTINGDQTYNDGPYTSISQLPQLVIIANKIIINSGVQKVNAWLIATQNLDSSIKTCEAQGKSIIQCATKLVVNGPVMTNQLYLYRTAGSKTANPGEPAETFNLRADAYLWAIAHASTKTFIQTVYNTELPPRF